MNRTKRKAPASSKKLTNKEGFRNLRDSQKIQSYLWSYDGLFTGNDTTVSGCYCFLLNHLLSHFLVKICCFLLGRERFQHVLVNTFAFQSLPLLLLLLVGPVSCMQTASTVIPVRFRFWKTLLLIWHVKELLMTCLQLFRYKDITFISCWIFAWIFATSMANTTGLDPA